MEKPILLQDVDGCLNPCPFSKDDSPDWNFETSFVSSRASGSFRLNLSKEMGSAIWSLGCDIRWATTWTDQADENIGQHIGWPKLPVFCRKDRFGDDTWKPRAVLKLIANPGPPVVWIDDDIPLFMEYITNTHGDLSTVDPHERLITISPELWVGITKAHIDEIKLHLKYMGF